MVLFLSVAYFRKKGTTPYTIARNILKSAKIENVPVLQFMLRAIVEYIYI